MITDPRYAKLAGLLVKYSIGLKRNERILLEMTDVPDEFAIQLMRTARQAGGIPLVETRHTRVTREVMRQTNEAHAALVREVELFRMKRVQAYIAVRGADNANEGSDVPSSLMTLYSKAVRPVLDYRINKTRWCVLRWPSPSMAQAANMSTEALRGFLLRGLHDELSENGAGHDAVAKADEKGGPGADQRPRHRSAIQHQGHRRDPGGGQAEHPRRGGVFLPGQEIGARGHPVQHADDLRRDEV